MSVMLEYAANSEKRRKKKKKKGKEEQSQQDIVAVHVLLVASLPATVLKGLKISLQPA